jgi:hypothetical protein
VRIKTLLYLPVYHILYDLPYRVEERALLDVGLCVWDLLIVLPRARSDSIFFASLESTFETERKRQLLASLSGMSSYLA